MIFKKILHFIDGSSLKKNFRKIKCGGLYKIKGEELPFRYIQKSGDKEKRLYRFKHHNLKEYVFYDLSQVERESTLDEIRIYNLIKEHVYEISDRLAYTHNY